MATIKNTIQTNFTSKGAKKVKDDTESVGRAQTRMGQSSASAGRSFAAQSQGLGGLVGAYAGAAATVFALEAAFTALAKAAQAETIVTGTSALAAGIAQSGPRIIKSIQEITQGQLTMAEAAQNANIGLSAGFDSTQIEGLTKVAMGASRALGRNLTDSLQRVFRGVAKLEPELLDELGIFVRIEPAVKAYARELGVAAKSLSQFERGQAFANAAIEEGTRKFGMIDVSAPSAQKSLEQLQTQVMELALEFGQLLTQILLPFVNFLKNDAGNALVLFGGILLLVFSKSVDILKGFGAAGLTNFTKFADAGIAKLGSVKTAMGELTTAGTKMNKQFAKGITGSSLTKAEINKMGGAFGKVEDTTATSGRFQQKGVGRDAASAASAARTAFIKGTIKSNKDLKTHIAALERVKGSLGKTTIAYAQTKTMINSMNASLAKTGPVAKLASAGLAGLAKVATGLGTALNFAIGIFSTFFIVASAFELAGVNIFGRIKDFFVDSSQAAANFKSAVTGAFTFAAGGSGEFTTALKGLGATDENLEKIGGVIKGIRDELVGLQTAAQSSANALRSLVNNSTDLQQTQDVMAQFTGMRQVGARFGPKNLLQYSQTEIARATQDAQRNFDTIAQVAAPGTTAYTSAFEQLSKKLQAIALLTGDAAKQQQNFAALADSSTVAVTMLDVAKQQLAAQEAKLYRLGLDATYADYERLEVLKAAVALYGQVDDAVLPVIGSLGRLTGLRMDTLTGMFAGLETEINSTATSLEMFGIQIPLIADSTGRLMFNFEALTKAERELIESSVIVSNAVRDAEKAFDAGATSSDKLSSVIAGATAQFLNSKEALNQYAQQNNVTTTQAKEFFDVLKERVRDLIKFRDELKKVEATYKGLTTTFKKEKGFSETLRFSGAILDEPPEKLLLKQAQDRQRIEEAQGIRQLAELQRIMEEDKLGSIAGAGDPSGFRARINNIDTPGSSGALDNVFNKQVESLLARSKNQMKEQQMAIIIDIGKSGNAYAAAAEKVRKYEEALDAAAEAGYELTADDIAKPNATEIQMAEALVENRQVALGILLEQAITVAEINDKFIAQYELAQKINQVARLTLLAQKEQALAAEAQAKFASSNSSIQQSIQSKTIGIAEQKNILTQKELILEEKVMDIKHEAAMIDAKGVAGAREAHLARMGQLKSEYDMQLASFKLYNIEKTPFMSFDKIKKARLTIIEMERDAVKANHKLRMAAIKAQAGASNAAAKAQVKVIKAQLAALESQFQKVQFDNDPNQLPITRQIELGKGDINPLTGTRMTKDGLVENPTGKALNKAAQKFQTFGTISESGDSFDGANENQKIRVFRREILQQEITLQENKMAHDLAMKESAERLNTLADQRQVAERKVQDAQTAMQREKEDAEMSFLKGFLQGIKGFGNYITLFAEAINANLVAEGKEPLKIGGVDDEAEKIVKDAISRIDVYFANIDNRRALDDDNLAGIRSIEDEIATIRARTLTDEITALRTLQTENTKLNNKKLSNFDNEMFMETEKERLEIKRLNQALELAERTAASGGAEAQFALAEAQQQYINEMARLGITTKKAKDELGKFDTDLQAISDTLDSELIDGFQYLGDILLGVNEDTKSFATGIENTFKKLMRSIIQEIQMQMITKPLAGMASDFIGNMVTGGIAGFRLPGTPIPFDAATVASGGLYAAGGVVHMSQGGQVNALRDRVPAMLEPGEFVIRKNSAKSIGRNKLGQMNATGGSGMGNVEFNIVNQGSPKQAEQQGMPKFDTDKLVIDVVMRDLENNGPIRKALRSG